jgi:hypothetical protein
MYVFMLIGAINLSFKKKTLNIPEKVVQTKKSHRNLFITFRNYEIGMISCTFPYSLYF